MTVVSHRLIWLTIFAIGMAHVEASLVVHLRSLYYPENPLILFPLSLLSPRDRAIELSRELATILMILSVAFLAEKGGLRIFAAFVYIFGLWDIFYYLWLKLMLGWPVSWLEWDILFLIPWPWLGPWITATLIALLFVVWGAWAMTGSNRNCRFTRFTFAEFVLGSLLCLYSFLLPAFPLLAEGKAAFQQYQPAAFSWGWYLAGYLLMANALRQIALSHRP
jgi:hypothetical protein